MGWEVEAGVGADRCAELAHDGCRPDAAAHDVADDQGRAAAAQGDDVVPVAADRGLGAAGVVGGGDAQVVRFFEFLGEQGSLQGHRCFALAAFAGAQAFGGFGVVGDVGGEDEDAAAVAAALAVALGDRGAGEGVGAAVGGLAGLHRARLAAALDLVQEGEQAEGVQFGERVAGAFAQGACTESGPVGVVDVGDAVVGAVDQGDEGRDPVEDLAHPQFVDGGYGRCLVGHLFGTGGGHGALPLPVRGGRLLGPRCGAALRSGEPGAPAREVHESLPRVVVGGRHRNRPGPRGPAPGRAVARPRWRTSLAVCRPGQHPSDAGPAGGVPGSGQDDPFGLCEGSWGGFPPAASSNSARGCSSEPSETISRLNSPARAHSASTRALRLKVGTRLRW